MNIEVSTDKTKLDYSFIKDVLSRTYWAHDRSMDSIRKSVDNSITFGLYLDDRQIGFARVLTDYVVFAYIMDVVIVENQRGKGYGKLLMKELLDYPELHPIKRWFLGTIDAAPLYRSFGFKEVDGEIIWMHKPGKHHQAQEK